jgi:hypothetical protein
MAARRAAVLGWAGGMNDILAFPREWEQFCGVSGRTAIFAGKGENDAKTMRAHNQRLKLARAVPDSYRSYC